MDFLVQIGEPERRNWVIVDGRNEIHAAEKILKHAWNSGRWNGRDEIVIWVSSDSSVKNNRYDDGGPICVQKFMFSAVRAGKQRRNRVLTAMERFVKKLSKRKELGK